MSKRSNQIKTHDISHLVIRHSNYMDKRGTQNYLTVEKLSILITLNKTLNKDVLINAQIIIKVV